MTGPSGGNRSAGLDPRAGNGHLHGRTIAVTGASGFCGGHVARALTQAGARVISVGRRPGPVGDHRFWDAGRSAAPDLSGADAVIHLAAAVGDPRPGTDTRTFTRVNVDGAARLVAAAHGGPIVWVSSASVYDPRLDRSAVDENHPRAGHLNAYGRTKALGEDVALAAGAVVLRPHAVYGSGDRHLLPRLLRAVRFGSITLPGNDIRITLTAVENLVSACLAALGEIVALELVFEDYVAWRPPVAPPEPRQLKQVARRLGKSLSGVQDRLRSAQGKALRLGLARPSTLTHPDYFHHLVAAGYVAVPTDRAARALPG